MACQVGNEAARDGPKHSAAYIIRAAVAAFVPAAGAMTGVHYDKRGGKLTIQYVGEDCSSQKDAVEEKANSICSEGTSLDQMGLSAEDKASMGAFEGAAPGSVGGVTVKKMSCNAAKEQIIIEFLAGKKPEGKAAAAPAAGEAKDKKVKDASAAVPKGPARQPLCAYDNTFLVSDSIVDDMLDELRALGISLEGKEGAIRKGMSGKLETTLTMFKNCAYTNGFSSRIPPQTKPHFG